MKENKTTTTTQNLNIDLEKHTWSRLHGFNPVVCTIKQVNVDFAKDLISTHPLAKKMKKDDLALQVIMDVKFEDGRVLEHDEVSWFLGKNGEIAFYGTYMSKSKRQVPGTFLYSMVQAIKEYSDEQASLFKDGLNFKQSIFKGLIFKYNAKIIKVNGEEKVILETPYIRKQEIERWARLNEENDYSFYGDDEI